MMRRVSFLLDEDATASFMLFLSSIPGRFGHLVMESPGDFNGHRSNGVDHHERAVAQLEPPPAGAIAAYADAQKAATSWARSKPKGQGGARKGAGRPKGSTTPTTHNRADLIRLLGAKGPFTSADLTAFGARYAIDSKSMANTLNAMRGSGKILAEKNEDGTRNTYRLAPEPEAPPEAAP